MTGNKVPCPVCGEMFDKRGLNGHIASCKKKHKKQEEQKPDAGVSFEFDDVPEDDPEEDPETFTCGICQTEIKEGTPTCPGCGGAFEW